MAFVTSICLLVLAVLYLGESIKHEGFQNFYKKLAAFRDVIGYWTFLYGIVGSFLSIFFAASARHGFLVFITSFLIIFLASPMAYPKLEKFIKGDNPVLKEELQKMVNAANNYGYVMSGIAVILAGVCLSTLF